MWGIMLNPAIAFDNDITQAMSFIKSEEGLRLTPYRCSANRLTVGYGHLCVSNESISEEFADKLLREDVEKTRFTLFNLVLSSNQRIALISFVFNVGINAFDQSTMRTLLARRDYVNAARQFDRWNKETVDKKLVVSAGLTSRRYRERRLFESIK